MKRKRNRTTWLEKVVLQLIDDLTGEKAQETVEFSNDGTRHEIDLSAANAAELRNQFERHIARGRRLRGGSASRSPKSPTSSRENPEDTGMGSR